MELAGFFIWLVAVSVIFAVYGKIAERLGNSRHGSYYLLLLAGAGGGVAYLIALIVIFSMLPYEFVLNIYILAGSALAAIIRLAVALFYVSKKKWLNRFQHISVSVIIGLGFFIVEIYVNIIFMKSFALSSAMLYIPVNTLVSSIIGASTGKNGYQLARGGLAAVLVNCICYYLIALLPLYKNSWFYLPILTICILFCIIYTINIARKAFAESVK